MAAVVLTDSGTARADQYDDQKAETQQAIDSLTNQKALAEAAVNELKAKADEQSSTYADYSAKLSSINAEIDDINSSMRDVTEQMAVLSEEMTEIKALRQQQYDNMQARIRYSYEEGSSSMWITLLTSSSFAQFLNRAEYYAQVAAYDAKIIKEYEETVEKLNEKTQELEGKQNELDTYQLDLDAKQGELEQLTSDVRAALNGTQAEIGDTENSVEQYENQLDELNAKMASLQWQQAQAQAELARRIAEQSADSGTEEGETGGDDAEGADSETTGGTAENREYTGGAVACTTEEIYLMAATIQAEADNQSYEGKLAVGSVICNRVMSSKFPSTVTGVITQSGQFASYSSGKVDLIYEHGPNATCLQAAQQCLNGTRTGDWLFFMTKQYADYYGITGYTVIGDHVFFYRWGAN